MEGLSVIHIYVKISGEINEIVEVIEEKIVAFKTLTAWVINPFSFSEVRIQP